MKTRRIIIASPSFFPQNTPRAFRATELAREFARQGHEVVVVTLDRGKETREFCREYSIRLHDIGDMGLRPIPINEAPIVGLLLRGIRRALLQVLEYPDIQFAFKYAKAIKGFSGYDLLISIAVPHPVHWGIAAIDNIRSVTKLWIADCGDPYMGCKTDSFRKFSYFKYVEKWFCRKAHFITVPTKESLAGYYREFHHKIRVIPQGFNLSEVSVKANEPHNALRTFGYAGTFMPSTRDPRKFLSYILSLNIDFRFIVFTNTAGIIEPFVQKSNGRIIVREYIPRLQLISELSTMDFLVNINNNTNIQTPSKLIDYLICNRPILSIGPELDEQLIDEFLAGNYSRRTIVPDLDRYDIRNVSEAFLGLLSETASK